MAIRRFTSEKSAEQFAAKVNGVVKDLTSFPDAKSKFKVTYTPVKSKKKAWDTPDSKHWAPEEGRDFGYPNEYWQ